MTQNEYELLIDIVEMFDGNIKQINNLIEFTMYNENAELRDSLLALKRREVHMQDVILDSIEILHGFAKVTNSAPMPNCKPVKPEPPELVYRREDGMPTKRSKI